jgi:hypothetical protein
MPSRGRTYVGAIDWYPEEIKPDRRKCRSRPKDIRTTRKGAAINPHDNRDVRAFVDVTEYFNAKFTMTAYSWDDKAVATMDGVLQDPHLWMITNNYYLSCEYQEVRDAIAGRHLKTKKIQYRLGQNRDMGAQCIFESVPFEIVQLYWKHMLPLDTVFVYTTRSEHTRNRKLLTTVNMPLEPDEHHDGRIGLLVDFNCRTTKWSTSPTNRSVADLRQWMTRNITGIKPFTDENTVFPRASDEVCFMADFLR